MINFPDFHLNGGRPNTINDINNPLRWQFDQASLSDISILCWSRWGQLCLDLLGPFWRPVDSSHHFNCDPPSWVFWMSHGKSEDHPPPHSLLRIVALLAGLAHYNNPGTEQRLERRGVIRAVLTIIRLLHQRENGNQFVDLLTDCDCPVFTYIAHFSVSLADHGWPSKWTKRIIFIHFPAKNSPYYKTLLS